MTWGNQGVASQFVLKWGLRRNHGVAFQSVTMWKSRCCVPIRIELDRLSQKVGVASFFDAADNGRRADPYMATMTGGGPPCRPSHRARSRVTMGGAPPLVSQRAFMSISFGPGRHGAARTTAGPYRPLLTNASDSHITPPARTLSARTHPYVVWTNFVLLSLRAGAYHRWAPSGGAPLL